jgi:fructose/tagatose bisphosphate aldolase
MKKHLDIGRIAEIKSATRILLILHGGSGTDDEGLRKAIAAGINVIHINTELPVAWRRELDNALAKAPFRESDDLARLADGSAGSTMPSNVTPGNEGERNAH